MALNLKSIAAPFAKFITTIQIIQMVIGMAITTYHLMIQDDANPAACSAVSSSARLGFVMYLSYFVLFAQLFMKKYLSKGSKGAKREVTGPTGTPLSPTPTASPVASITKAIFTPGKKLKQ